MNQVPDKDVEQSSQDKGLVISDDVLIVLPVRNIVTFPGAISRVALGRQISIAAVEEVVANERKLGMLLQLDESLDLPTAADLYKVGTIISIVQYLTAPNGMKYLICLGEDRFRVLDFLPGLPFLATRFERLQDLHTSGADVEARVNTLKQLAAEAIELLPQAPQGLPEGLKNIESPAEVADLVASLLDAKPPELQQVLAAVDVKARLDLVMETLTHRLNVMRLEKEIGDQTKEKLDEQQRRYLLREQLKTIQRELGENGEAPELENIASAIEAARMPPEVEAQANKELRRLRSIPEASTEHSMVRAYLDWLISVPWSKLDDEQIDIKVARQILDEDHFGLDKIKRRILEYLAVRKLNPLGRSPILCFVGPPGVGKTSLGQSIARALGLKFTRASLGGVHDEAEIRGHRRTYIGAMPGSIIQSIGKVGTRNPVFMLDEMDKLGVGFHGDPSSALLEVLDPAQNTTFKDHYLDVPFDLSKVLFVATANVLDNIPGPLRDRMEIIELPGYTQEEKLEIARRYLIKRQQEDNGLQDSQVTLTDKALAALIDGYTREPGVRNLEREIGALMRNAAMAISEGTAETVMIDVAELPTILGAPRYESEVKMRTSVPGVATGLAWTPAGGDILFLESSLVPGKGNLLLTGQLGDVMKESAQAAVFLAKIRAESLAVPRERLESNDLHIHVPAGAIPKDGPSAGVALFVSLVSLLTDRAVRPDIAMTGEISLRGLVLPVGGIKEKTLAALRAGIKTVLLPARNRRDLEDIPASARAQLEIIWLDNVDDALKAALGQSMDDRGSKVA